MSKKRKSSLTISAKPDGVGAASQRLIPTGEQSGLRDAHRDDGKRFVVRADEKLTAFVELESAICACGKLLLTGWPDFFHTRRCLETGGQGRKLFSRSFLPLFQTCTGKGQLAGKTKKEK